VFYRPQVFTRRVYDPDAAGASAIDISFHVYLHAIGNAIVSNAEAEGHFYGVIKTCLMANLNGYAPQVAVEFGRKAVPHVERPTFQELDEYLQSIK